MCVSVYGKLNWILSETEAKKKTREKIAHIHTYTIKCEKIDNRMNARRKWYAYLYIQNKLVYTFSKGPINIKKK